MVAMNLIIDKLILLVSCLAVYLTGRNYTYEVAPILLAVIFTSLLSYTEQWRTRIVMATLFLLSALLLPWSCIFLPLISYELLFSKKQWLCLLAIIPLSLFLPQASIAVQVALCVLFLLSGILKFRTIALEQLQKRYFELRDTTKEMALKLKQQNQDLLDKQDNEITMATLGERNRIAREIHDNVGHLLSRALLQTGAILTISREDNQMRDSLSSLKDTLSEAMSSIRASVHDLHDDSIDLHNQLKELVRKFTFCPLVFDYSIQHKPGRKLTYALISIVKEALSNIVRHSNATHASITIREHPAFYQLIIKDNGYGQRNLSDQGIGLKNISDRVEAFGGLLNIEATNGFKLFISIPKEENK